MTQPTCPRCARPIPDVAYVCSPCGKWLHTRLDETAALAVETTTTVARLARVGDPGGRARPAELDPAPARPIAAWLRADPPGALRPTPLPYLLDAARDVDSVANTLTTWARHCAGERGHDLPDPAAAWLPGPACTYVPGGCRHETCETIRDRPRKHPITLAATYLATQVDWLRHRPEAAQAYDEIADACFLLEHIVDRKPDRWYAGACDGCTVHVATDPRAPAVADPTCSDCGCKGQLYALPGAVTITCPECGACHDAGARKAWLLDLAQDRLVNARQAAHLLSILGTAAVAESTVRSWVERKRLVAHGSDSRGWPVYRLGDAHELACDENFRKQAEQARRERHNLDRRLAEAAA